MKSFIAIIVASIVVVAAVGSVSGAHTFCAPEVYTADILMSFVALGL